MLANKKEADERKDIKHINYDQNVDSIKEETNEDKKNKFAEFIINWNIK